MQATLNPREDEINLTDILTSIIADIVRAVPLLRHIDVQRTLVCIGSNKTGNRGCTYGKLVPLKFENGSGVLKYRNRYYGIPEIIHDGRTYLYIIYFYMPRFFNLSFEEKLRVIFHELYHISPEFNGDIRRMGAVKKAHGHSKKHFDAHYAGDLKAFIGSMRDESHIRFLKMDSGSIFSCYGTVNGMRMKNPRPVLLKK